MNEATTKTSGMQGGAQMRISPEERELIARTFKGNETLLRLMRKIFLPEIDPAAPTGQVIDLWLSLESANKGLPIEEQFVNLKARNLMITHTDQCLMQLEAISNMDVAPKKVPAANSTR